MLEINCLISIDELKLNLIEMNWYGTSHCQIPNDSLTTKPKPKPKPKIENPTN